MLISPEEFERINQNKPYSELLYVRNNLLDKILKFERQKETKSNIVCLSPKVVYQYNLEYLGKICSLLAHKYNWEFANSDSKKSDHYLFDLQDYLISNVTGFNTELSEAYKRRLRGESFSIQDHIKGLVYAQLTPQQEWHNVVPHLPEIDAIFFNYNPEVIKANTGEYFTSEILKIKCGNRSLAASMNALNSNIQVFEQIQKDYGSLDAFVTSDAPNKIVKRLSAYDSKYKLKQVGESLAWEYIRNVGIDGAKPDEHLCRFLGADRMGTGKRSPASIKETLQQVESLSIATGLSKMEIDKIIWTFCSNGNGEISPLEGPQSAMQDDTAAVRSRLLLNVFS